VGNTCMSSLPYSSSSSFCPPGEISIGWMLTLPSPCSSPSPRVWLCCNSYVAVLCCLKKDRFSTVVNTNIDTVCSRKQKRSIAKGGFFFVFWKTRTETLLNRLLNPMEPGQLFEDAKFVKKTRSLNTPSLCRGVQPSSPSHSAAQCPL
jgi:hypothetical protein